MVETSRFIGVFADSGPNYVPESRTSLPRLLDAGLLHLGAGRGKQAF
jgi:hypothetical protein